MPNEFAKQGLVQYFYHSPSSMLPIRDVLDEQCQGNKTEPHIEIGAENFLNSCYQRNIQRLASSDMRYLFLITRCANPQIQDFYSRQMIVGYMDRRATGQNKDRTFILGDTFLFSFQDSVLTKDIFGFSFNRPRLLARPDVNPKKTAELLDRFSGKPNVLEDCLEEIKRLDPENLTCYGCAEEYSARCKRFN